MLLKEAVRPLEARLRSDILIGGGGKNLFSGVCSWISRLGGGALGKDTAHCATEKPGS
jgi:hypothetical protein